MILIESSGWAAYCGARTLLYKKLQKYDEDFMGNAKGNTRQRNHQNKICKGRVLSSCRGYFLKGILTDSDNDRIT